MLAVSLMNFYDETQRMVIDADKVEPFEYKDKKLFVNDKLFYECDDLRVLTFEFYRKGKVHWKREHDYSSDSEAEIEKKGAERLRDCIEGKDYVPDLKRLLEDIGLYHQKATGTLEEFV